MFFLMSSSMVLSHNLNFVNHNAKSFPLPSSAKHLLQLGGERRKFCGFALNAKKDHSRRRRSWWQRFFFDEDGNWLGLKDDDMLEVEETAGKSGEELTEGEKFEAWKRRAEAIVELREAQEDMLNEDSRRWEDWVADDKGNGYESFNDSGWTPDGNGGIGGAAEDVRLDPTELVPQKGFVESVRDLVLGQEDEDILYEDRVFRYASLNSAKFLAVLILVPLVLDFVVHDYVLMPFLDRYVKTVPLAAQILDVRKSQKLQMVKELRTEKARIRLEVEIGKSPPLSDEEVWWELRHKVLERRDELRLENRRAFANIWSDMVFGISLFLLLYFNQNKVALLKFSGYKIINNATGAWKAFTILLIIDALLGYHSERGWLVLVEVVLEHYGLEVDQSAITIFVGFVPVFMDTCVKLWLFKFLPRLSPKVAKIVGEMKRH